MSETEQVRDSWMISIAAYSMCVPALILWIFTFLRIVVKTDLTVLWVICLLIILWQVNAIIYYYYEFYYHLTDPADEERNKW